MIGRPAIIARQAKFEKRGPSRAKPAAHVCRRQRWRLLLFGMYGMQDTVSFMYVPAPPSGLGHIPIHRKLVGRAPGGGLRVFVDAKARPFAKLALDDLVDSADVCAVLGCSARSLYRWVGEGLLAPAGKYGRDYLFSKREVLRWQAARPSAGRPGRD
jgi:Helix-turn-helix domain